MFKGFGLIVALLFALVLAPVSAQVDQENTPAPCGDMQTTCGMLTFATQAPNGDVHVIVSYQTTDPALAAVITSDAGIVSFIEGFGQENVIGLADATELASTDLEYLRNHSYRVIVGETNITGTIEPIIFMFISDGTTAHIFAGVGEFQGFNDYVEDAVTGPDWTITPSGYVVISGT